MNITVRVWRQPEPHAEGKMAVYKVDDISEHMSFLEMLDVLNERLTLRRRGPDRLRQRLPRRHLRHVRRW